MIIAIAILFGAMCMLSIGLPTVFMLNNADKTNRQKIEEQKRQLRDIGKASIKVWNDGFYQGYCRGWEDKGNYKLLITIDRKG